MQNVKKYKNSRKNATDVFNREVNIGDTILFNNGAYRGSTIFTLGIVIGFTAKKVRIVADIYSYARDQTKLVDDHQLVLMAPIDSNHSDITKLIELADPFLLGDKMKML